MLAAATSAWAKEGRPGRRIGRRARRTRRSPRSPGPRCASRRPPGSPRSTAQAGGAGQSACGRMPTAITTIGRDRAVLRPAARASPSIATVLASEHHGDPLPGQPLLQQGGGAGVELALHQPVHRVQHRDAHAAPGQPDRGLEPEQPAADHHGVAAGRGMPRASAALRPGCDTSARRGDPRRAAAGAPAVRRWPAPAGRRRCARQIAARRPAHAIQRRDHRVGPPGDAVGLETLGMVGDQRRARPGRRRGTGSAPRGYRGGRLRRR